MVALQVVDLVLVDLALLATCVQWPKHRRTTATMGAKDQPSHVVCLMILGRRMMDVAMLEETVEGELVDKHDLLNLAQWMSGNAMLEQLVV